ncbi:MULTISPECIES: DUF4870 domain-containing protein [Staphylococcus]|uniref:DUF4870 domain-containing protein n=1 Tax=Staphylococcus hsinchuensis TaxID=3051183 RepID=A0ABZ3EDC1_9STAP|nr:MULTISPECIES: DUF4870 domain-containing protein [unclassified Staphylococcus]
MLHIENRNNNDNVLSALSYFSILFAPVIFPLLVWIISKKQSAQHGKQAFFNQIVLWIMFFIAKGADIFYSEIPDKPFDNPEMMQTGAIIVLVIFGIIALILFIKNIAKGIKLLTKE